MTRKTIAFVVGARPNFVKMAPVIEALERAERIAQIVVHTGQHYDAALSDEILAGPRVSRRRTASSASAPGPTASRPARC